MASTAANLNSSSGSEDSDPLSKLVGKMKDFARKSSERSNNNQEDKSAVLPVLEQLHSEIVSVQEGVVAAQLFKKGADLYSNWLELAFQHYSEEGIASATIGSESSREKVIIERDDEEKVEIRRLIALAYNNRGYLKYLEVDFEGAITDYTRALSQNPNLAEAYYNRGLVTYRLAFFDQSVEDMIQAVKLDPSKVEFQEGLTRVKEMLGSPNGHNFKLKPETVEDAAKKKGAS